MTTEKTLCDCGHLESDHSPITRGYGKDKDGKTFCYDCCTARDKEELKTNDKVCFYISNDGKTLTNWPGFTLGVVLHWGAVHPWSRGSWQGERNYLTVKDCHGQKWHGTGAPGMYCTLRKNKK